MNPRRLALAVLVAGLCVSACPARAQRTEPFAVGASVGLVNVVDNGLRLNSFDPRDLNLWLEYRAEDDIAIRGTFGSLRANGYNAGNAVTVGGTAVVLPALKDRINYVTCSVSYLVHERGWESGLFAGVGGYRVDPDQVSNPAFAPFRDETQTVWGLHAGLDADFQIWHRTSLVVRVTYHVPATHPNRQILTVDAGLNYRF